MEPSRSRLEILAWTLTLISVQMSLTSGNVSDEPLKRWLSTYLEDGETRLVVNEIKSVWNETIDSNLTGNWDALPVVCNGKPSLQTKSHTIAPNGGCPDVYTNAGISCTCLEGYDNSTEWEFYIQARQELTSPPPLSLNYTQTLGLTSLMTIWVPTNLTSIKIVNLMENNLMTLPLKDETAGWNISNSSTPSLVKVRTSSTLQQLTLENVDLNAAFQTIRSYIPPATTSLTLRHTNLRHLPAAYVQTFATLESLDLSHNNLQSTDLSTICRDNPPPACHLKSINLTANAMTAFPHHLLHLPHLTSLYLDQNPITNRTISSIQFETIANLLNFTLPAPTLAVSCHPGTRHATTHHVDFCVLESTDSTIPQATPSTSSTSLYLVYVLVPVSLLLGAVILLFFLYFRHRLATPPHDESTPYQLGFNHTFSFNSCVRAATPSSLLLDPNSVLVTHRLPFHHVTLVSCINKGGFGLVYTGTYNRRRVAIKRIRTDFCQKSTHIQAFVHEIALLATFHHPRIVEFLGVAWDTLATLSAVTEYMERGDLREVLQSFEPATSLRTWYTHKLRMIQHIAEALTYLHSLEPKVVHRDLKSKNVLLNATLDAKLCDFGAARERQATEMYMTSGIGTSFWIAPEVLLGENYNERADLFSLGIVMSEIDTQDYPYWNAKNPTPKGKAEETAILRMVAAGELVPDFTSTCPQAVFELAMACLAMNPADRPSAIEVVYAIQQIRRQASGEHTEESQEQEEEIEEEEEEGEAIHERTVSIVGARSTPVSQICRQTQQSPSS